MIEVIYKEEKQEAKGNEGLFAVPRNIRQIGLPGEDYRIYVEDYVYTFLVRLAGADMGGENEKGHLAVLTGESKWQSGITYVFVRGALTVEKTEAAADHIDFSEEVWSKIHDEQELYFPGQEIVGWFFAQQELQLEITEVFRRVHLKHFGGGERVLMLMDPAEREDAFFRYENNFLVRQPGYYLFYEKNPLMQNYMLDKNQEIQSERTEEVPDEAVIAFRKIIKSKKKRSGDEKTEKEAAEPNEEKPSIFSYAATACLAIAVFAVGISFYRNYQAGYSLEQQIQTASAVITGKRSGDTSEIPQKDPSPTLATKEEIVKPTKPPETDGGNQVRNRAVSETKVQQEANASEETTGQVQSKAESDDMNGNADTKRSVREETEAGESKQIEETTKVQEEDPITREESDLRKAKRRQELAAEENENRQSAAESANTEEENRTAANTSAHASYVIRPGDTLYQISIEKYGSMDAIADICRLNGLSENEIIYPGQIIVLP